MVGIVLLLEVILVALAGLPILWWPRRNSVPAFDFSGPRPPARTRGGPTKGRAWRSVGRQMREDWEPVLGLSTASCFGSAAGFGGSALEFGGICDG